MILKDFLVHCYLTQCLPHTKAFVEGNYIRCVSGGMVCCPITAVAQHVLNTSSTMGQAEIAGFDLDLSGNLALSLMLDSEPNDELDKFSINEVTLYKHVADKTFLVFDIPVCKECLETVNANLDGTILNRKQ